MSPTDRKQLGDPKLAKEETMKLCKDCKFCNRSYFPLFWNPLEFAQCEHPDTRPGGVDPVSGKRPQKKYKYCDTWRMSGSEDVCGPDGKWFEPKS